MCGCSLTMMPTSKTPQPMRSIWKVGPLTFTSGLRKVGWSRHRTSCTICCAPSRNRRLHSCWLPSSSFDATRLWLWITSINSGRGLALGASAPISASSDSASDISSSSPSSTFSNSKPAALPRSPWDNRRAFLAAPASFVISISCSLLVISSSVICGCGGGGGRTSSLVRTLGFGFIMGSSGSAPRMAASIIQVPKARRTPSMSTM
mmetsp:Transcript_15405/g.36331  ORF Transcript_15405/g.36331 Transcript_15405/m.36331 type:complete len:206 (+) Transcript_15405:112-729(+)